MPEAPPPWPTLVGFHGYGEDAARHLAALGKIPGSDRWLLVAVQALHPFYTKDGRVVASWMTRQDRELAIADNIRYVGAVVDAVVADYAMSGTLVFAGFSQGGAMAYRAAAHRTAAAVIVLAADVPPDVIAMRATLPPVLIGRGTKDTSYTDATLAADLAALRALGARAESCTFDGGHEWAPEFYAAAGAVLERAAHP